MELFIGDFNFLIYRTVQSLSPTQIPGVILIYGPPGVGKSYWLEEIYQRLKRQRLRLQKLEALNYAQQYAYSVQCDNLPGFRRRMRTVDLFILDDLQLLAGKKQTIEELLYTYEHLIDRGGKLVVALQAAAPNLDFLGARLSSRLLSGQVVPILGPQTSELKRFIERYLHYHHLIVEDDAVVKLASVLSNLSEVEYVIKAFVQFAEAQGCALTQECFDRFWECSRELDRQNTTLANILRVTGEVFGLAPEDISGERRTQVLVNARQLAMYISRQLCSESYAEIGRFYQRRHGTVLEACRQMNIKLADDKDLKEKYWQIQSFFRGSEFTQPELSITTSEGNSTPL